jgi:hypothetical protein
MLGAATRRPFVMKWDLEHLAIAATTRNSAIARANVLVLQKKRHAMWGKRKGDQEGGVGGRREKESAEEESRGGRKKSRVAVGKARRKGNNGTGS